LPSNTSTLSLSLSCFFFYSSAAHRALHSFPTRRSSDLDVPLILERLPNQQGTDLTFLRELARRNGFVFYTEATAPGVTSAYWGPDRKSTRLNSSHQIISYAVFCLKKKKNKITKNTYKIK